MNLKLLNAIRGRFGACPTLIDMRDMLEKDLAHRKDSDMFYIVSNLISVCSQS